MTPFNRALAIVLRFEGGSDVSRDPEDPGGITRWGISQRSYPDLDIPNLTYAEAAAIYELDYWRRCQCDALPPPLALMLLDSAVNQGPVTAIRLFQNALSHRPADGIMGPKTIQAAKEADPWRVVVNFVERRWDHYNGLSISRHYLRGWTKRLFQLEGECLRWAAEPA